MSFTEIYYLLQEVNCVILSRVRVLIRLNFRNRTNKFFVEHNKALESKLKYCKSSKDFVCY